MSKLSNKTVKKISSFLKSNFHTFPVIELAKSARTAKEAADTLQVPVGAIVKALLFILDHGKEELPVITLISGDKKCKIELIPRILKLNGKIRIPNASEVKNITSYSIGGVSPILLPDNVKIIIDTSLKRFDKIWSGAGHPRCVFCATYSQLMKMTNPIESDKIGI